ncbi:tetratricopeptide repeat protein [Pseudoduganella buxea]|uniref:Tetratricopeptide repeat protein n=2 Tax=Pseudoduganella buxea TaxID=1949069 RepID=A0ABQ1KX37_9BURK|nr:tetratricopeptide repeat protein [Pseudoduganella buxea]GGC11086.1 hypothetical protein GCM10011572_35530 [Pseudoduganella buxea]
MSLINKMLQDLDARGSGGAVRGPDPAVRPVGAAPRNSRLLIAAGAAGGVALLAAGGVAWYFLHTVPAPVPVSAPRPLAAPAAVTPVAPPAPAAPVPSAPPAVVAAVPVVPPASAAPVTAVPPSVEREPVVATPEPVNVAPRPVSQRERPAPRQAPAEPKSAPAERVPARVDTEALRTGVTQAWASAPPASSQGQAENGYRRALVLLQDGRLAEGIATLEQALFVYPRHEAARQTVAGLLLEQGRNDEASRHLQLGLGLNPNQPQMAMLLARLQLEHHGAAAVETLRRTLPHASANADYLGFLAAALQRQRRHREAIEQYDAALRLLPQNGVWWMGLGISLQAEGRKTEARAAFTRAKQAGLSPELQGFVERSLGQLN